MKTTFVLCLIIALCGAVWCLESATDAERIGMCNKVKCTAGEGEACSYTTGLPELSCIKDECVRCSEGLKCSGLTKNGSFTGTCKKIAKLDDACQFDMQCRDEHLDLVCSGGKCVPESYQKRATSDKCSTNSDCYSSVCTDGRCAPVALGGACRKSKECPNDAYCSGNDVCTARNNEKGAACSSDKQCKLFTEKCENDRCVEKGVVGKDEPAAEDYQCKDGLVVVGGKCTEIDFSKTTDCGLLFVCRGGMKCSCNTIDPSKPPQCVHTTSACEGTESNLDRCLQDKGCNADTDYSKEGSCGREKCLGANKAIKTCYGDQAKKARKGLVTDECLAALYGSASPLAAAIGMLF